MGTFTNLDSRCQRALGTAQPGLDASLGFRNGTVFIVTWPPGLGTGFYCVFLVTGITLMTPPTCPWACVRSTCLGASWDSGGG